MARWWGCGHFGRAALGFGGVLAVAAVSPRLHASWDSGPCRRGDGPRRGCNLS